MEKIIIVKASVQPTKVEEFLRAAKIMISKSNQEQGCLSYRLSKDVNYENEFFFYEKYKNEKAVESHNLSAHYKTFISLVMPLLCKAPVIEIF